MTSAGGVNDPLTAPPSRGARTKAARAFTPVDLPAPPADPLAALFRNLRPLGAWAEDAACADLPDELAEVFTADNPDPDALAVAESVCWRCDVRTGVRGLRL